MVIGFLEGSDVMENGVAAQINKQLKRIIRKEQNIKMYFYCTTEFMTLCEWEIRKMRALYPEKKIEVFIVVQSDGQLKYMPAVRYSGHIMPPSDEVNLSGGLLKWLVDQSDYVLCYMDLLMTSAKERETAYHYACSKLGERCINFCSNTAKIQVRAQISSLPRWERRVMEGRLIGEKKKTIAADLGVTTNTVRRYEVAGQKDTIRKIYKPEQASRQCAVFGFSAQLLSKKYEEFLAETIQYLIHCCGISCFILPEEQQRMNSRVTRLLSGAIRRSPKSVKLGRMRAAEGERRSWPLNDSSIFYFERRAKSYAARILEERKEMINRSDIILCDIGIVRRSGLSHASKKHIPVINIADIQLGEEGSPLV